MNKQKVNGVILIDKPQGMTSQQVVSKVKYLFMSTMHNSKKAGHTGTLDPMATGLLPICLGESTKFSHYQLDADKSYQAIVKLGIQTDTGDADGKSISTEVVPEITAETLAKIAKEFTGDIQQVPPMYSALKKDGKKLYEYARAGIEIDRPARDISIKELTLVQIATDEILLKVTCSKGTYVRVLGEDIAKAIGTLGHLIELRRTAVGRFRIVNAISLEALESEDFTTRFQRLMAVDACIDSDKVPSITLDDEQVKRIRNGQRLNVYNLMDKSMFHMKHQEINQNCETTKNSETTKNTETTISDKKTQTHLTTIEVRMLDSNFIFIGLATLEATGRLQPTKLMRK